MAVNLKREIKLNVTDKMRVRFGTVDRFNPSVVYLSYRAWVTPTVESNYGEDFEIIKKNIHHIIRKTLSDNYLFSRKYILDFLMNGDTLNEKRNKCVEFSVYLRQKGEPPLSINDLFDRSYAIVSSLTSGIESEFVNNGFDVNSKKDADK